MLGLIAVVAFIIGLYMALRVMVFCAKLSFRLSRFSLRVSFYLISLPFRCAFVVALVTFRSLTFSNMRDLKLSSGGL